MHMIFNERSAFITGGSSGIGLAIGTLFARLGANVCAFSIDPPPMREAAVAAFEKAAGDRERRFEAVHLDVTDPDAVKAAMREAIQRYGAPFVLVNSAGMGGALEFEKESFERLQKSMALNLYGTRHVIAACLPAMKEEGVGHIVNVASVAGLIANYGYTTYSAAKHAVVGFTLALRAEMKPFGINVVALCPVQVDTPMLAETDKTKPAASKAINDTAGVMSADAVAEGLLWGMKKRRAIVIPGAKGRFLYWFSRVFPGMRERATDRIIQNARRN